MNYPAAPFRFAFPCPRLSLAAWNPARVNRRALIAVDNQTRDPPDNSTEAARALALDAGNKCGE
jgi:hypothetical protein